MSESNRGKALDATQRMRVAYLLTLAGGMMDAYTYTMRGGVFANAQSGNIVKLGIALANRAPEQIPGFLLPIMSFSAGVLVALAVEDYLVRRGLRLVRRSILLLEVAGLALVWAIPVGPDWNWGANCVVSFVAALQFETFKTFRGESLGTTMSTGNLRNFVEGLYLGVIHIDRSQLVRSVKYCTIIATFVLGAFLGTVSCDKLGQAAVAPAMVSLALAAVIITILHGRNVRKTN